MENRCQPEVDWKTGLVCPPYREIQYNPVTINGCLDLAFPLLPWNGYQGQADEGGQCNNLGQPGKGMSVGANSSSRNYIEVTIYSYCKLDVIGSPPQSLEQIWCLYTSQWNHVTACLWCMQTMSGICTATNPAAESTVSWTRLNKVGEVLSITDLIM